MARASALHAEGQRFDSVILHNWKEHIDMMETEVTQQMAGSPEVRKATRKTRVNQTSAVALAVQTGKGDGAGETK